jgi:hypothetical protein
LRNAPSDPPIMAERRLVAAGVCFDENLAMNAGDRIFFELDGSPGYGSHTVKIAAENSSTSRLPRLHRPARRLSAKIFAGCSL